MNLRFIGGAISGLALAALVILYPTQTKNLDIMLVTIGTIVYVISLIVVFA